MSDLQREAYGPHGDPEKHLPLAELEAALGALPSLKGDTGRLALVVRRRADGAREVPERVLPSPEEGVPGDGLRGVRPASPTPS